MEVERKAIVDYLCEKIEFCQSKGCYTIKDAYVLKECVDFLQKGSSSNKEINESNSVDGVMQALNIGQSKGVFSLDEAHKIYEFTEKLLSLQLSAKQSSQQLESIKEEQESKITEI